MKVKLSDLVLDFSLYPRGAVSAQHVAEMCAAFDAGAEFPLIVFDKKSKRVTDGFHRHKVFSRKLGNDAEIEAQPKAYKSEAEMYADAMRFNSQHGLGLSTFDKTRCVLRGQELGLSLDQIAAALSLTVDAVGELTKERVGTLSGGPLAQVKSIPLKRTIGHMAGAELTPAQSEANDKLSGMPQYFYIDQIITLIESDLLDTKNDVVMARLKRLAGLLERFLVKEPA